ncbi:MAG: M10 family metallopeptidase [Xenococcaceae cyanobacterium MO_188.B29]|nr:M10 family metallopeptidase [Xenococcaceae cyanobacterium MO_188.B29]
MTFGQATPTSNTTATGINNIDSLLASSKWASDTVTFSFTDSFFNDYESGYPYYSIHSSSFENLNDNQRWVTRYWFDMYEDVSNLNTFELTGGSDRDATIRLAESDAFSTAYGYYPGDTVAAGDAWFNLDDYNSPTIGNFAFHTFGHEIGHALGLEHGHEANGISNVPMDYNRDSMEFSIMTYRSYVGAPTDYYRNETWGYAQSLMMYDIAAIQQMYGANFNTNSGNTTYSFSTSTGEMFVNDVGVGTPGGNRIFRTIWDGNGIDTYNFSNYSTNLTIDLAPGSWSNLDSDGIFQKAYLGDGNYARGHVFNALQYNSDSRSLIENAIGGSGNDTIFGNDAANELLGLDGNDYLFGDGGSDILLGGSGSDTLTGGSGHDRLVGYANGTEYDTLTGESGTDTFVLGDSSNVFYQGDGYATITDFNYLDDYIEVRGTSSQYSLEVGNWIGDSAQDVAIFYGNDAIGVVQDYTNVNFTRDFLFV